MQQDPCLDDSASSQLLMEDVHQGVTSAAAARSIDRYRAFVQAQKAPVAQMLYSPFTKQKDSSNHIATQADATHRKSSLFHSQSHSTHGRAEDKSRPAAYESNLFGSRGLSALAVISYRLFQKLN